MFADVLPCAVPASVQVYSVSYSAFMASLQRLGLVNHEN